MADTGAAPIGAEEFSGLMAPLGPFEPRPNIAVGCSGGGDSLALTLLLQRWARAQGGTVFALIVDHGLRREAAAEAVRVAAWLSVREVGHCILTRPGPPATANVQAVARDTRYALMSEWCRANNYLHLAIAHHLEDQAETVLLRLARGSGLDGLSAMASVAETRSLRIIRPLLFVPKRRLALSAQEQGQTEFIDDYSNRDRKFARVRLRDLQRCLAEEGLTPRRLAETSKRLARSRAALEEDTAAVLAHAAVIHNAGYCRVNLPPIRYAAPEISIRAIARIVRCIGGGDYSPRQERLENLYAWLVQNEDGRGRTLGGCRIVKRRGMILFCREAAAAASVAPARGTVFWDNRFRMNFSSRGQGSVKRLGADGWRMVVARAPLQKQSAVPPPVRPSLPAVWRHGMPVAVPHLGFYANDTAVRPDVVFSPKQPLTSARFTLY